MPHTGAFNQAGDLRPRTGPYGAAFKVTPGVLPGVLWFHTAFRGWVGKIQVLNVADKAIVPGKGYGGVTPARLQPVVNRPDPWDTSIR